MLFSFSVYTDQPMSSKSPPTRDKLYPEGKAQARIRSRNNRSNGATTTTTTNTSSSQETNDSGLCLWLLFIWLCMRAGISSHFRFFLFILIWHDSLDSLDDCSIDRLCRWLGINEKNIIWIEISLPRYWVWDWDKINEKRYIFRMTQRYEEWHVAIRDLYDYLRKLIAIFASNEFWFNQIFYFEKFK